MWVARLARPYAWSTCLVLVPAGLLAQPLQPVGVVDGMSGQWVRVQDQETLARGSLLYEGDTVRPRRPGPGAIEVLLFAGYERWRQECTEAAPCSGSYRPRSSGDDDRGFWAFLSSFWSDGRQLPGELAGARAAGPQGPRHALLVLEDGGADLGAALTELGSGTVSLRLDPAPGGSRSGALASSAFTVEVGAGRPVRASGLQAGLYLLTARDASGQAMGGASLVLVHPDQSGRRRALWEDALDRTARDAGLDPATRASLLAYTLYALDARTD